jgi:hypothetical protein
MNAFAVDFGKLVVAMAVAMWYFADNPQRKVEKDDPTASETDKEDGWAYVDPSERCLDQSEKRQEQIDGGMSADEAVPEKGPPGSALPTEPLATLMAVKRTARYHIGSIAFGAFIIAVVRLVRAYLLWVQATSQKYQENRIVKCLFCLVQCYMKCLEDCVEFINKNAYIQIGLFGKSFCRSAYNGFTLVMRNIILVGILDGICDALIFVGKICITILSTIICYLLLKPKWEADEITSMYLSLIITACMCWFISGAFLSTYDMATDTLLLCILEDKERFSGPESRNYWNDELEAILDRGGSKKRSDEDKGAASNQK